MCSFPMNESTRQAVRIRILQSFNFYDGEIDGFVEMMDREGLGYFETIWWSRNQQVRLYKIHFTTTETLDRAGRLHQHSEMLRLKRMSELERAPRLIVPKTVSRGQYFRAAKRLKRNADEVFYALGRSVETSSVVSGDTGKTGTDTINPENRDRHI
jgi:hypothetical protein